MNAQIREFAKRCYIDTYGVNGELLNQTFDEERFAQMLLTDVTAMVTDLQGSYENMRKISLPDEREIYAEGAAACDLIKFKIKTKFGGSTNDI